MGNHGSLKKKKKREQKASLAFNIKKKKNSDAQRTYSFS